MRGGARDHAGEPIRIGLAEVGVTVAEQQERRARRPGRAPRLLQPAQQPAGQVRGAAGPDRGDRGAHRGLVEDRSGGHDDQHFIVERDDPQPVRWIEPVGQVRHRLSGRREPFAVHRPATVKDHLHRGRRPRHVTRLDRRRHLQHHGHLVARLHRDEVHIQMCVDLHSHRVARRARVLTARLQDFPGSPSSVARLRRALVLAVLFALIPTAATGAQGEGTLRGRIGAGKAREQSLSSAAARLGELERRAQREVAILQGRLDAAQQDLNAAQGRLQATQTKLDAARARAQRLRGRLAQVRTKLAGLLRERYMGDEPDFVTVVLSSDGFPQLLETLSFVKRVQRADANLLDLVRSARLDAGREQAALVKLEAKQQDDERDVQQHRDALAQMTAGVQERRDTIARAQAARLEALSAVRANRLKAEHELSRLLAARARAAAASVGPAGSSGPWAIPWPIVQCESGGQNLPPNSAGASGYYQFLPSTWKGLGGSTPAAYQASKAEQDRLAARLWAGGAGRSNWVCAGLV